VAQYLGVIYGVPFQRAKYVRFMAKTDALIRAALQREPGDRVLVDESVTGVNNVFTITSVRLELEGSGRLWYLGARAGARQRCGYWASQRAASTRPRGLMELIGPTQVHGVRSAADYRAMQRTYVQRLRAAHPHLSWLDPWVAPVEPPEDAADWWRVVTISGGKYVVRCACGNRPSVDPNWRLACCFQCGAIYEGLEMPPDEVVRLLTLRVKANR
jgi:hypothetical protein